MKSINDKLKETTDYLSTQKDHRYLRLDGMMSVEEILWLAGKLKDNQTKQSIEWKKFLLVDEKSMV